MSPVDAMLSMALPLTVGIQRLSASKLTTIHAVIARRPRCRNSGSENARSATPPETMTATYAMRAGDRGASTSTVKIAGDDRHR